MKRSGSADLPLHSGYVPPWLSQRMASLGLAIVETMVAEFSPDEVLSKLSNPFWFQSFGAVMGMDWHSSGITTSVMGALKRSVNPHSKELGIYICGGKGKNSLKTPAELMLIGAQTGLDGDILARSSKLTAKVDSAAIQDGFQLYMHNFIVSSSGKWAVVQQGMDPASKMARRYHWHSDGLISFTEEPHSFIYGRNKGKILNLTAAEASATRDASLQICHEHPEKIGRELALVMPSRHDVRESDVNLKRLGALLWLAHDSKPENFDELILLKGVGPRTLQSLALVSEIIYGTPSRFDDPARFSFAHGGKDGHPFPVPVNVYDQTIQVLSRAVTSAKIGNSDKLAAFKSLGRISQEAEKNFTPNANFNEVIENERRNSHLYGGRTVFGKAKPPEEFPPGGQLSLLF